MAGSAAALALPWLGGELSASLFEQSAVSPAAVLMLGGLAMGLFAVKAAFAFASGYFSLSAGELAITEMRAQLYEQLQSRRLDFIHRRRIGELLSYFGIEVETVSYFISGTILRAVPLGLTVLTGLGLIAWFDPVIGVAAFVAMPLFLLVTRLLGRRIYPRTHELNAEQARALGIVQENLSVLPAIKAYRREGHEAARYREQLERVRQAMLRQQWSYQGVGALNLFFAGAVSLTLIGIGAWRVSTGVIDGSELVAMLLYGFVLISPLTELGDLYARTRQAAAAAGRLQEVFDAADDAPAGAGVALPDGPGRLAMRDVSFSYGEGAPVLQGLDLEIEPGETVAIIGANGAGKTTLAHLLMRFYSPNAGTLELDGVDIAGASLDSLRSAVALVPQTQLLTRATIRDNIAFGRTDAGDEDVRAAARAAGAHEFIEALPQGYATVIGERGVTLSGGQRQRLSLARALVCDPRVLILDEATAMFDPESELAVLLECRELFETKTVLLITHRPALLELADRTVRIDGGRAVEIPSGRASLRSLGGGAA